MDESIIQCSCSRWMDGLEKWETELPYDQKYWSEVNLAVGLKTTIAKLHVLADLHVNLKV